MGSVGQKSRHLSRLLLQTFDDLPTRYLDLMSVIYKARVVLPRLTSQRRRNIVSVFVFHMTKHGII
jgi:hypothetical protein